MGSAKAMMRDTLRGAVGEYVRIVRSIDGAEAIDGFIVAVGKKWCLLARDTDYTFDGFVCLRVADVERVRVTAEHQRIAEGAWVRAEQWPPPDSPTAAAALDRTGDLLELIRADEALLAVHIEYDDPDVMFLGIVVAHQDREVALQELSPEARWTGTVSRWSHHEISRIDYANNYCRALSLAAEPRPAH